VATLLVTGAGSAAAENLVRSLRRGDPSLTILGCSEDRFALKHSTADASYLVPRPGSRAFVRVLRGLIQARHVDLVVPTADLHVSALSDARHDLLGKLFLPDRRIVDLCRDKYRLTVALRRRGIRAPETYPVTTPARIDELFVRLHGRRPLWCRPRSGTCARGGGAVSSPEQARAWIRIWNEMRGLPVKSFTLSEYLPGREILCQSVWDRGRLVLTNTFERLSYFGVDNIPSGVTSLSSLAKTVCAPRVVDLCRDAVRAIAPRASGVFSIDVKEDARGRPYITEINAGRFFMAMTAFDHVLGHSMALTYVRLALGQDVELDEQYDGVDDYYMVRDLDLPPAVFHADRLFDGIEDPMSGGGGVNDRGEERTDGQRTRGWRGSRGDRGASGRGKQGGVQRIQASTARVSRPAR
jgi:carbamoylphosphate synthase large subunit